MNVSVLLKRMVALIFYHSGIARKRLHDFHSRGKYLILMYHRIVPPDRFIQEGMYVTPETFENHLSFLNENFTILPLNALMVGPSRMKRLAEGKPLCFLTFDDGWRDFYDYAYPLLQKYQTPSTVFLPTGYVGTTKKFWTCDFAHLLRHRKPTKNTSNREAEVVSSVVHLNGLRGSYHRQLEMGIEFLKSKPLPTIEKILSELARLWHVDTGSGGQDFMSWSEVEETYTSGLVTFGSHTHCHQILTTLDHDAILKELSDSRLQLLAHQVVDRSSLCFCYPSGNHSAEISEMVRASGYQLAVTTQPGWNDAWADMVDLKRVGMHEDMTSTRALLACRIACLDLGLGVCLRRVAF